MMPVSRQQRSFMKNAVFVGVMAATVLLVGCAKKSLSSSATPPSGSKAVALSDGSNTWFLGAMTMNGTNVSGTNITIRVRTGEGSK